MKNTKADMARLGIFVLAGIAFLISTLYLIGNKRNMFSSVSRIHVYFKDVAGLVIGGNVRFSGITIGTVDKIKIKNDTLIQVTMTIRKEYRQFIKRTAFASIGTDGLMGATIVNITSDGRPAPFVEEGDFIQSSRSLSVNDMLQTLNRSGENLVVITEELKTVVHTISTSPTLHTLLSDHQLTTDLKQTTHSLKTAGLQIQAASTDVNRMIAGVKNGKGAIGYLLQDDQATEQLTHTLVKIKNVSDQAETLATALNALVKDVQRGDNAAGALLADTAFHAKLNQSLENVEKGTARFNTSMEALQHTFLFRSYFRKQERKARKNK